MLKIAWSEIYNHPLPANHRFPMIKYDLIPEQLLYEGTITTSNLFEPVPPGDDLVIRTHDRDYFDRLLNLKLTRSEERKTGFPLSASLVQREITIAGGTLQCALYALENGIAMNVAGGTHHAFRDRGEGFCLLNDMAIAANVLLDRQLVYRILIVDLDVHQGNGTAAIFSEENSVYTLSMHGENNYPATKMVSDRDVPLKDGTTDAEYLVLLRKHFTDVVNRFRPDFLFYQAGVDVLKSDKLGRLGLTQEGCRQRDKIIMRYAAENKIPLVVTMGGGYSSFLSEIVNAHANTFRLAQDLFF